MTTVVRLVHRCSLAFVVCGLLLASQAFVVSAPRSPASDTHCSSLRAWGHAFENTSLTLDQIARFDRPHRLAIFNAVTPSVRASLWREQLRRFESQPDLTAAQRALVAEGRTLISPALYEREPAAMAAYQRFWTRASESFMSFDQRRAWGDLGSMAGAKAAAVPVVGAKPPNKSSADWCQCSTSTGAFDCFGAACFSADCQGFAGCGSSGSAWCNGVCAW
jgi:hypothetical protein